MLVMCAKATNFCRERKPECAYCWPQELHHMNFSQDVEELIIGSIRTRNPILNCIQDWFSDKTYFIDATTQE